MMNEVVEGVIIVYMTFKQLISVTIIYTKALLDKGKLDVFNFLTIIYAILPHCLRDLSEQTNRIPLRWRP